MKWLIISAIIIIAGYLLWPKRQVKVRGRISELAQYLRGLQNAGNPQAFLITDIIGTPHFIQFSRNNDGVQLNMPLITTDQISIKETLEKACRESGLQPQITQGSDGSEFLDCEIDGENEMVISVIEKIVSEAFEVSHSDKAKYTLAGYCQKLAPNNSLTADS